MEDLDLDLHESEPIPAHGEFFMTEEDMMRLYEHEYLENMDTMQQITMCSEGVLGSLQTQLFTLVLLTVIQRLVVLTYLPSSLKHLLIAVCSMYALIQYVSDEQLLYSIIVTSLSILSFILYIPFQRKGFAVTVFCVGTILYLEYSMDAVVVSSIRGILMIMAMKLSALAFDVQDGSVDICILSHISYLFNPATVIFGPFMTFSDYLLTMDRKDTVKAELKSWLSSFLCLALSILCVLFSSCATDTLSLNGIMPEYATAQSFRFSHYFICFLSQGLYNLSGGSQWITRPQDMEFPRSLVDVVVSWNIPMHNYLRKYIYKKSSKFGSFVAILITFSISAMLHGLNFQLSAVLLTLALLCHAENKLRNRLSSRLSACVRSRPCKTCNHVRKTSAALCLLLNALFSLLSIYHLIYLGCPFDGSSDADTGYTRQHTLQVWQSLSFSSHFAIPIMYILAMIL